MLQALKPYRVERKFIFTLVLNQGAVTPSDISLALGVTCRAASKRLLRLHRQEWLRRRRLYGGGPYRYTPSQKLVDCYDTYPA